MSGIKCECKTHIGKAVTLTTTNGKEVDRRICIQCKNTHQPSNVFIKGDILILIKIEYKLPMLDYYIKCLPTVLNKLILDYIKSDVFCFTELNQTTYSTMQQILYRAKSCSFVTVGYSNIQPYKQDFDMDLYQLINQLSDLPGATLSNKIIAYELWNRYATEKSIFCCDGNILSFGQLLKHDLDKFYLDQFSEVHCFEPLPSFAQLKFKHDNKIAEINQTCKNKINRKRQITKLNQQFKKQVGLNNYLFAKWTNNFC